MTQIAFSVAPAGICGMDVLAKFLNALKVQGAISDWQPGRAESGTRGARFFVGFPSEADARCAEARWESRKPSHTP